MEGRGLRRHLKVFDKKSHNPKTTVRAPIKLARYCTLRGKEEKPFWFSTLVKMIQFGTIKFCRTTLVSSCGLKKKSL